MDPIYVYITAPNVETARKLGRRMVDEYIVACVNILPEMQAIYRWNGRIEEANEVVIIAKTTLDRFDDIIDFIALEHPYEVPCVVAIPLVHGEESYMKWIVDNSVPPVKLAKPAQS